ncbi:MAG: hypothetical protein ACOYB3_13510 [Azonexus sp.]
MHGNWSGADPAGDAVTVDYARRNGSTFLRACGNAVLEGSGEATGAIGLQNSERIAKNTSLVNGNTTYTDVIVQTFALPDLWFQFEIELTMGGAVAASFVTDFVLYEVLGPDSL